MNRIEVKSSSIKSVGYDNETETLEVEFTRGAVYIYNDVDVSIYNELIEADSVGKYFSANIVKKFVGVKQEK